MKVQVIGNNGSFLKDVCQALLKEQLQVTQTNSADFNDVEDVEFVIFVGGETRNESAMNENNVVLPLRILNQCKSKNIYYLYLSSLSVFGWCLDDVVTTNSKRSPIDIYGITKLKMDQLAFASEYRNYCAVLPASINAGRGRSSVEKIEYYFTKLPFLKLFSFPGSLSYIDRDELISIIISCLLEKREGLIIASKKYTLSQLSFKYSVPFPRLPLFFFKPLSKIIGKKKALLIKMVFRGIEYS